MIKIAVALAVLMAVSAPCAAEDLYAASYATCIDQSGGVTVAMLNCIAAEVDTQDSRLNKAYQALGTRLPTSRKEQLTSAQRLWVQYRDANCNFYADPDGATAAAVASNECELRETAERARELEISASGE